MGSAIFDWGRSGLVSLPVLSAVPEGFPFTVAICAVALPPGCMPPRNGTKRRLAVGRAASPEMASFVCLAEAAERYSLQFSDVRPTRVEPFEAVGGAAEPIGIDCICLGAPAAGRLVTSVGAAAGETLADAAVRAVLELLEHHHVRAFEADRRHLPAADAGSVGSLDAHREWLGDQLRRLDVRMRRFAPGYWVALCRCSDLDGGRPTLGSAAGTGREPTMTAAAEEALFHWRNMVALEANGVRVSAMTGAERGSFERYRGAVPDRWRPSSVRVRAAVDRADAEPDLAALMQALHRASGARLRLFDLTLPEVGVPVVKACLG